MIRTLTILLMLALFATCLCIVNATDELCAQLGVNPWIVGIAVVGAWAWTGIWFCLTESRRLGHG